MTEDAQFAAIAAKYNAGSRRKRGAAGQVELFVVSLIIKGELPDVDIAEQSRKKFGGSTSVKSVQWYRHKLRTEGRIPPAAKRKPRAVVTQTMYEVLALPSATGDFEEDTYTSAALIKACQNLLIKDGAAKSVARDTVYHVPTCTHWLATQGYEVIAIEV